MTEKLRLMVIMDGLVSMRDGSLSPHPALRPWHGKMARMRRRWFEAGPMTALEWFGHISGLPGAPSAWLASAADALPEGTRQLWVVSPYHAVVSRDAVQVTSEISFDWQEKDTDWLVKLLNPLLAEDGITLIAAGSLVLAASNRVWDVQPQRFACIAGGKLPNRLPQGADAGHFVRLMSEMQMLIAQHSPAHRQGRPEVSGVWLWGESPWPAPALLPRLMPAISGDCALSGLMGSRESRCAIIHAKSAHDIVPEGENMPVSWLLAGESECVLLDRALFPRLARRPWRPRAVRALPHISDWMSL